MFADDAKLFIRIINNDNRSEPY